MNGNGTTSALEKELDNFKLNARLDTLEKLLPQAAHFKPNPRERVNLHLHSFFSYNMKGYSPAHLAWEARKAELYAVGLCDFDVLDGLEEFLTAAVCLGLRATVNLETRAFLREFAAVDINSPGEPGVTYIMGGGFAREPATGSRAAATLALYRKQAHARNEALVKRINERLPAIALDYQRQVVPLSPGACPTERHIVRAYRLKAEGAFKTPEAGHAFWATLMKKTPHEVETWSADVPVFEEKIRAVLAKSGGIGYERPTETTFPPVDDFIRWVLDCQALPMVTWLDGASQGEDNMDTMLDCLAAKGCCAVNIIPDRNHNIADPDIRAAKLKKLAEVMAAARRHDFPVNIGTEMNKDGQPFFDDTECAALRPYHAEFLRGARIMVGHTILTRYADYSYVGAAALQEFRRDTVARNAFFESVGKLPPLSLLVACQLGDVGPAKALARIRDAARQGRW